MMTYRIPYAFCAAEDEEVLDAASAIIAACSGPMAAAGKVGPDWHMPYTLLAIWVMGYGVSYDTRVRVVHSHAQRLLCKRERTFAVEDLFVAP